MRLNNKLFVQQHRPKKNLLIAGATAVIEAMNAGQQLERIYLQANINSPETDELRIIAEKTGTPVNKVPF
ncbi:MAG: RNA methyltransferase substrate-binding domain-containing protein, partial [Ginsengibacter sp.]